MNWQPYHRNVSRPKCTDPRDNVPPHHDPPAKRDYSLLWVRICRERLHNNHREEEDQEAV